MEVILSKVSWVFLNRWKFIISMIKTFKSWFILYHVNVILVSLNGNSITSNLRVRLNLCPKKNFLIKCNVAFSRRRVLINRRKIMGMEYGRKCSISKTNVPLIAQLSISTATGQSQPCNQLSQAQFCQWIWSQEWRLRNENKLFR